MIERKLTFNNFDQRLSLSVIFQTKILKTCWFQLLKWMELLLFFVIHHNKSRVGKSLNNYKLLVHAHQDKCTCVHPTECGVGGGALFDVHCNHYTNLIRKKNYNYPHF